MDRVQPVPAERPEPEESRGSRVKHLFSPDEGRRAAPSQDNQDALTSDSTVTVRQPLIPAGPPFYLDVGGKTDRGQVRENNEDNALLWTVTEGPRKGGLFAVADGLGGRAAGEVASDLATQKLRQLAQENWLAAVEADRVPAELQKWIHLTNTEVFNAAFARHNGMATTVTAAVVLEQSAYVANVGDSRTYLWHAGAMKLITHDHSLVSRLVDEGLIQPQDIYSHPRRNEIYRALGVSATVDVDVFGPIELAPQDRLLLCSDGLWEKVHDEQLQDIVSRIPSAQACCDELIRVANANGGQDNITAVIVRLT